MFAAGAGAGTAAAVGTGTVLAGTAATAGISTAAASTAIGTAAAYGAVGAGTVLAPAVTAAAAGSSIFAGTAATVGTGLAAAAGGGFFSSLLNGGGLFGNSGIGVTDLLGGAMDAVSLISGIAGSRAEIDRVEQNNGMIANNIELTNMQLMNQATADRIALTQKFNNLIAHNITASFASGIKPTGSVQAANVEAQRIAEVETSQINIGTGINQAQSTAEGFAAMRDTSGIKIAAIGSAAEKAYDFFDRYRRRG